MLKIRLSRTGKNRQPSFRVVVQEHTAAVKGKFIEVLGYYRPAANPKEFKVDLDKIKYWMSVGAQPSDSLAVLLKNEGVEGLDKYIAPRNKKRKKTKEDTSAAAAPAPAPAEAPKAEAPKAEEPKAEEPAPAAEPAPEVPAEEVAPAAEPALEEPKEETPAEEKMETPTEAPAESTPETPAEPPAEPAPVEEPKS